MQELFEGALAPHIQIYKPQCKLYKSSLSSGLESTCKMRINLAFLPQANQFKVKHFTAVVYNAVFRQTHLRMPFSCATSRELIPQTLSNEATYFWFS